MSRENVEAWLRALEASNRRDIEGLIAEFDPEVEFKPLIADVTDVPYRGEQGVRDWVAGVDEEFDFYVSRAKQVEDHGDFAIIVAEMHARGRTSGAEVRRQAAHLARFKGGRVVWWQTFATREEALAAAGVREPAA